MYQRFPVLLYDGSDAKRSLVNRIPLTTGILNHLRYERDSLYRDGNVHSKGGRHYFESRNPAHFKLPALAASFRVLGFYQAAPVSFFSPYYAGMSALVSRIR